MSNEQHELMSAARAAFVRPFDGVIALAPDSEPALWIDSRNGRETVITTKTVKENDRPVCTWRASRQTLLRILGSEQLLVSAFLSGRLSIEGDMSVMARLSLGAKENG